MSVFNLNPFLNINGVKFMYSEFYHEDEFLIRLHSKCYLFHQFAWNVEYDLHDFPWDLHKRISRVNPLFPVKSNIIFCAPNSNVCDYINSKGYRSILLNHNCLLDWTLFKISTIKEYDAVINSRPFWWKRVYLSEKIPNKAYLMAADWAKNSNSWSGWKNMIFSNIKSEAPFNEVVEIISKSKMGLILSGNTGENQQGRYEGANYSSMEYLLCGLPVLTTPNQGGRNFWLNNDNSVIAEPNLDSVFSAYKDILNKIESGDFNGENIRDQNIAKMKLMRNNMNKEIDKILIENGINYEFKDIFSRAYWHKFVDYTKSPSDAVAFINN